jgi:NADH:ubiquinone oxidoreductase subunit E
VISAVTDRLGIESHQTTADGKFTLLRLECLGACDGAPVALVDGVLHERLNPDSLGKIIDEAGRGGGHH